MNKNRTNYTNYAVETTGFHQYHGLNYFPIIALVIVLSEEILFQFHVEANGIL